MLTKEQEKTLETACDLYIEALKSDNEATSLDFFNQAFGMLAEYIDEADDIYYRLVFANCIEEMQRKFDIEFSPVIIQGKTSFYLETMKWFLDFPKFKNSFRGHIIKAFDALGRLFLLGEDGVQQDDDYAHLCYQCLKALDFPMVDVLYLRNFVKDTSTDKWLFVGIRPE